MTAARSPVRQDRPTSALMVFDSSPLILLDRLGYLPALRELRGRIIIPTTVSHELSSRPGMPASNVPDFGWVLVRQAPEHVFRRVLAGPPSIDSGEAESIAVALDEEATVVLDDFHGRERARRLGVRLTGTAGELLALHRRGLTDMYSARSLEEDLRTLRDAGMHLSETVLVRILRELQDHG